MADAHDVVDRFVAAVNAGDDDALRKVLADEFVDRTPNPYQGSDRDAFVTEKVRQLRTSFPDLRLSVEQVLVDGDRVAFLWTLTGTNKAAFADQDATGIAVEFKGVNIERVVNGRIAEHWSIHDALGLFHQLGRLG